MLVPAAVVLGVVSFGGGCDGDTGGGSGRCRWQVPFQAD